ncbi:hypothetical protein SAMN05877831_1161 [Rhodobacter maris]|uniref:Uncharacterized protein n=1 Tax=Rhodobacter maris TaxID=446682 RepID=A0A285T900_9RHOB|nr:hypothetical protein SAMN05877831_1161 [Rhodobacter maris]
MTRRKKREFQPICGGLDRLKWLPEFFTGPGNRDVTSMKAI